MAQHLSSSLDAPSAASPRGVGRASRAWSLLQLTAWGVVALVCWALPPTYTSGFSIAGDQAAALGLGVETAGSPAQARVLQIASSLAGVAPGEFPSPQWRRDGRGDRDRWRVEVTGQSAAQVRQRARALFDATQLEGERLRHRQSIDRAQQEQWLVEDLREQLDTLRRQHPADATAPGEGAFAFDSAAATLTALRARRAQVEIERAVTARRIADLRRRLEASTAPALGPTTKVAHVAPSPTRMRQAVLRTAMDPTDERALITRVDHQEAVVPERLSDALPFTTLQGLSRATAQPQQMQLLGKLLSRREQWDTLNTQAAFLAARIEQAQTHLSEIVLTWTLESLDTRMAVSPRMVPLGSFEDVELPLRVEHRRRDLVLALGLALSVIGWCASRSTLPTYLRALLPARKTTRRRRRRAARFALI